MTNVFYLYIDSTVTLNVYQLTMFWLAFLQLLLFLSTIFLKPNLLAYRYMVTVAKRNITNGIRDNMSGRTRE